ncbi:MAG: ABC transporter ATP-binding protein [Armatimonadota bacterium]|nr:ABC transporter ATP-binding protein [Armatimonadota bacterium]MDR7426993.1 ABC transporter ATP-binding protein [Armatimonadota bacterium]MDR7463089.1 ABC transporter ATP-binding protein [Armatimonadota bacterium]MDR7469328.1 ABC transporter ATP-binding protein [Armatimonadota bacterium]MDR7475506.1 ABC transporter ATP-binding protein [Armatimonadota bacterium]
MIVVTELTRRFGETVAVDRVSLEVGRGELFGLLGPDGAGKTTLLRMLCGILAPSEGTARVGGADVRAAPDEVKAVVGYVPQAFALWRDLTVLENLQFIAETYALARPVMAERMQRLLAFSRLSPFARRQAEHLSGGMRQKLALAAALIHEPEVLLLDEPTTGVDPVSRREFWQILYELNRQGKTVILATPYMDEAERCTRVALMHRGRILSVGSPGEMKERLPGVLLEVVAEPRRAALAVARRMPQVRQSTLFGESLHLLVSDAGAAGPIRLRLAAEGITVQEIRPLEPSLEDVFVALLAPGV